MTRTFIILLFLFPVVLRGQATTRPASRSTDNFAPFRGNSSDVSKPGFHKMIYQWSEDGQTRRIPFSIYLPKGYGTEQQRWPMLTFLAGLGDRGNLLAL